jgi:hypothetical protein
MELQVQAQMMWLRNHKSSLHIHSKFLGIWCILEGFIAASLIEAPGNVGVLPADSRCILWRLRRKLFLLKLPLWKFPTADVEEA